MRRKRKTIKRERKRRRKKKQRKLKKKEVKDRQKKKIIRYMIRMRTRKKNKKMMKKTVLEEKTIVAMVAYQPLKDQTARIFFQYLDCKRCYSSGNLGHTQHVGVPMSLTKLRYSSMIFYLNKICTKRTYNDLTQDNVKSPCYASASDYTRYFMRWT